MEFLTKKDYSHHFKPFINIAGQRLHLHLINADDSLTLGLGTPLRFSSFLSHFRLRYVENGEHQKPK